MSKPTGSNDSKRPKRLNVYLRNASTLDALKMIAFSESMASGKQVRVNDLANTALEDFVKKSKKASEEFSKKAGEIWDFFEGGECADDGKQETDSCD